MQIVPWLNILVIYNDFLLQDAVILIGLYHFVKIENMFFSP